ncbi:MAG: HAMP domain-containing histidine kinase [Oligoflexia bacterium]|nr:HAMP domain-containing histidine kinase [Oligoflexia bacterium]
MPNTNLTLPNAGAETSTARSHDFGSIFRQTSLFSKVIGHLALGAPLVALLKPSLREFLILVAVDVIVVTLLKMHVSRFFTWLYPECLLVFRGDTEEAFGALTPEERIQTIEAFSRFPVRAAKFMLLVTAFRAIPSFLIILVGWQYPGSAAGRATILGSLALVVLTYIFGAALLETHSLLSNLLAKYHTNFDLSEAFLRARHPEPPRFFFDHEILLLSLIIGFTFVVQALVILTSWEERPWEIALQTSVIGVTGIALFLRVWYLGRSYFSRGLDQIFRHMNEIDYQKGLSQIPLHTDPVLARPQKTFNLLIRRLWTSEQELSFLARHEAEKSRYQALGEMSARLAHDLSGPLHVAQFCVHELNDQLDPARRKKYLDHLAANVERAVELVTSLRARLKNPEENPSGTTYFDAHVHVVRLLGTQFAAPAFQQLGLELDPAVRDLKFRIQRVDLIQILDNLYRNSVQNLLANRIRSPHFKVLLLEKDEHEASILLSDNGTGLSKEKYEELTLDFTRRTNTPLDLASPSQESKMGLGLRLTRRLVELNGGSLRLYEQDTSSPRVGTTYCLKLRLASESDHPICDSKGVVP